MNLGLVRLVESLDFEHGKTGGPLARLTPSWEHSSVVPKATSDQLYDGTLWGLAAS